MRLLPGLRFNYDQKDVDFDQQVYGGLQTTNAALIALQRSVLAPQSYTADVDDTNVSGQGTVAFTVARSINTFGGEWVEQGRLLGCSGQFFTAFDTSYRSTFSSSASASTYLVVDGYTLLNARFGVRAAEGWTLSVWWRNLMDTDYDDLLSAAPGNSGLYVGQPGDPRTVGVTLRLSLKGR